VRCVRRGSPALRAHAIAGIEQAAEDHLEPALRTGDNDHVVATQLVPRAT